MCGLEDEHRDACVNCGKLIPPCHLSVHLLKAACNTRLRCYITSYLRLQLRLAWRETVGTNLYQQYLFRHFVDTIITSYQYGCIVVTNFMASVFIVSAVWWLLFHAHNAHGKASHIDHAGAWKRNNAMLASTAVN